MCSQPVVGGWGSNRRSPGARGTWAAGRCASWEEDEHRLVLVAREGGCQDRSVGPARAKRGTSGSGEVGEGLTGGLELGFEGGDLGGLLGAGLLDDLVERGREVLVQFLGGARDGSGRDGDATGQVGRALLEL